MIVARAVALRDLLQCQGIAYVIGPDAAPFLGYGHAEETQFPQLRPHLRLDLRRCLTGHGTGGKAVTGEGAGGVADHGLVVGQHFYVLWSGKKAFE